MKISENFKSILAWIGLISIVPNTIVIIKTAGVTQSIASLSLIIISIALLKWRSFLNYVRNTESSHSFSVINDNGDVLYERQISLLPLLWPLKTTELFMSLSGKEAKIEHADVNCEVKWDKQEPKSWHGIATLPKHIPVLFSFGRNAGVRVELSSLWKKAVIDPPHDFIVASGAKRASKIILKAKWCESSVPIEVSGQYAPFPAPLLLKKQMVDTTTLPWKDLEQLISKEESDGSKTYILKLENPRKYHMYRIFWVPREKIENSEYLANG